MNRKWFLGGLAVAAAVAFESGHCQYNRRTGYNFFSGRSYDNNKNGISERNSNSNSRVKSTLLDSASNAISDTVSAALSWDPTGLLESNSGHGKSLGSSGSSPSSNDLSASSNSKYTNRRRKGGKRGRGRKQRRKNRPSQRYNYNDYYEDEGVPDGDDDYYNSYDRDDGYSAPDAGYSAPSSGYEAPSSGYGAPAYEAPSYEAPSYSAPSYSAPSSGYGAPSYGGGGSDFNDFLNALAAFLPIALFLAAIPPNLITVNTRRRRKRRDLSDDNSNGRDDGYSAPDTGYPPPDTGYSAPSSDYGYGAPSSDFGYGAPSSDYGYGAPSSGYGYSSPDTGYSASEASYCYPSCGGGGSDFNDTETELSEELSPELSAELSDLETERLALKQRITEMGELFVTDSGCQQQVICQRAVLSIKANQATKSADTADQDPLNQQPLEHQIQFLVMHQMIGMLSILTPELKTNMASHNILKAVQNDNCQTFYCPPLTTLADETTNGSDD